MQNRESSHFAVHKGLQKSSHQQRAANSAPPAPSAEQKVSSGPAPDLIPKPPIMPFKEFNARQSLRKKHESASGSSEKKSRKSRSASPKKADSRERSRSRTRDVSGSSHNKQDTSPKKIYLNDLYQESKKFRAGEKNVNGKVIQLSVITRNFTLDDKTEEKRIDPQNVALLWNILFNFGHTVDSIKTDNKFFLWLLRVTCLKLIEFDRWDLLMFINAFAKMGFVWKGYGQELQHVFFSAIKKQISSFEISDVSQLLRCSAWLEISTTMFDLYDLISPIKEKIIKNQSHLNAKDASQLRQAYAYYKWIADATLISKIDSLLKEDRPTDSSFLHARVASLITKLTRMPFKNEVYTSSGRFCDILFDNDEVKVIIEIDGPYHFENGEWNQVSLFQSRVDKLNQYDVIRLHHKMFRNFNRNYEAIEKKICQMLSDARIPIKSNMQYLLAPLPPVTYIDLTKNTVKLLR